jgi:hypothetical protein
MSRNNNVILAKNINVAKLKFSEPKVLSNGSRTVYINYENEKLTIQTPLQRLPYGVGDWANSPFNKDKDKKDDVKKYDLQVSFTDLDMNPKMKSMLDKMYEIEKRIHEEAFANRVAWLQDDFDGSEKMVAKLFVPIVKIDKDPKTKQVVGKYPPTMKLKLPYDNRNDCFSFESQDMDGEALDFKSIMTQLKGSKARLIIQLSGLWFAGGRYGCTWKLIRGMFEVAAKKSIAQFIVDSDDEADVEDNHEESDNDLAEDAAAAAAVTQSLGKLTTNATTPPPPVTEDVVAEDEDEAEDDDDSEVDEPPPPPPKKTPAKPKAKK